MNRSLVRRWGKLFSVFVFSTALTAMQEPVRKTETYKQQSRPAAGRFDVEVRADIFAGLAGDRERFEKAMKYLESTLAQNPKHAEAMVWHGSGVYLRAGWAFQQGDLHKGAELRQKGMDEMNAAVALAPENVAVLIPRAAVLLEASKRVPTPAMARELIETAVNDYEKILQIQTHRGDFKHLTAHARGELLMALASGWHRLGNQDKAGEYFGRLTKEVSGTAYAEKAGSWLETKTLPPNYSCIGCHAGQTAPAFNKD